MAIYLFIIVSVTILAISADRAGSGIGRRLFLAVASVTMVAVAGLRSDEVGTDTGNYVRIFNELNFAGGSTSHGEYGFSLLIWILRGISDQYVILLVGIAILCVLCFQYSIGKCSVNLGMSYFIFIAAGFYTFFFNGARQGIACAIYSIAITHLINKEFKKYLLVVLIAALFHKTAIITIPLYFVFNRGNTRNVNCTIVAIGILEVLLLPYIVDITSQYDSRYSTYGTAGEGGGTITAAYLVILSLFFLIFKKYIWKHRESYESFLNMVVFGAVFSLVPTILRVNPSGILRLNIYFTISTVFLWPLVYVNLMQKKTRLLFSFCLLIFYLAFFILSTQRFSNLVPYTFNPVVATI